MPSEFELIRRHFVRPTRQTVLAAGDDGAIFRARPGMELVVSTDMLVSGTHFYSDTDPEGLGWKTLAVNVSDLAAMGAEPRWALLAAALPGVDEAWVAAFARGFFACAEAFGVDVIGGDTTRGPLNFCVTIFGEAPQGRSLLRAAAQDGDDIWVSGHPGRAALGLAHLQGRVLLADAAPCLSALLRPQPRVALGLALRNLAHAAIDVSDGLLADLGHILEESRCGAELWDEALPWDGIAGFCADPTLARQCLLGGGDDYELVFTAPAASREAIAVQGRNLALPLTRIGRMTAGPLPEAVVRDAAGTVLPVTRRGFDHFA